MDSVAVNEEGGTLETYRREEIGHHVPLPERFGGWHLTGIGNQRELLRANRLGWPDKRSGVAQAYLSGAHCNLNNHPHPTSDIVPQLVHEHQAGFTNLAIESIYTVREMKNPLATAPPTAARLNDLSHRFARYILFADEAPLPPRGVQGDGVYHQQFISRGHRDEAGRSLRISISKPGSSRIGAAT